MGLGRCGNWVATSLLRPIASRNGSARVRRAPPASIPNENDRKQRSLYHGTNSLLDLTIFHRDLPRRRVQGSEDRQPCLPCWNEPSP